MSTIKQSHSVRGRLDELPFKAIEDFRRQTVNFVIQGRRTSASLDPVTYNALERLARRERMTLSQIATMVATRLPDGANFSGAIRAFTLAYWISQTGQED